VALKAILRVGMHAGVSVSTSSLKIPKVVPFAEKITEMAQFEAGVEVGVFAHGMSDPAPSYRGTP
jgi:hypothetical protein